MTSEPFEPALKLWKEKLAAFEQELAITASAENQFELRKKIQKCNEEIQRLESPTKSDSSEEPTLPQPAVREQSAISYPTQDKRWFERLQPTFKQEYTLLFILAAIASIAFVVAPGLKNGEEQSSEPQLPTSVPKEEDLSSQTKSPTSVLEGDAHTLELYNVTFSSPEHTVGKPPAIGNGYSQPSSIKFGNPTVESSLKGLKDQPLVLRDPGKNRGNHYDQIQLDIGREADHYLVYFDVLVADASSGFSVFFDTPRTQKIYFTPSQLIEIFQQIDAHINSENRIEKIIGTYETDVVYKFLVEIDIRNKEWIIKMNTKVLYEGKFYAPSNDLTSLRFSNGKPAQTSDGMVGIDNIKIEAKSYLKR